MKEHKRKYHSDFFMKGILTKKKYHHKKKDWYFIKMKHFLSGKSP